VTSDAVALFWITQRVPEDALFACGSMVLIDHFVYRFSARSAEKRYTTKMESTALPKAKKRQLRKSYKYQAYVSAICN
jgi:hypothetical protein